MSASLDTKMFCTVYSYLYSDFVIYYIFTVNSLASPGSKPTNAREHRQLFEWQNALMTWVKFHQMSTNDLCCAMCFNLKGFYWDEWDDISMFLNSFRCQDWLCLKSCLKRVPPQECKRSKSGRPWRTFADACTTSMAYYRSAQPSPIRQCLGSDTHGQEEFPKQY